MKAWGSRPRRELGLFVLGLGLAACGPNGEGRVDAVFSRPECPPGETNDALESYGWDAGYLATDRFQEVVIVQIQEFNDDITETDSVSFRLSLQELERAGLLRRGGRFYELEQSPTTIPIGMGEAQAQTLLGLYQTCERLPNYAATGGTIELTTLRLRVDGADTGRDERIVGRVIDAPVSFPQALEDLGVVQASFDFEPPRRPLREFE